LWICLNFGRDPYELVRLTPEFLRILRGRETGNAQRYSQTGGPAVRCSDLSDRDQVQAIANGQRVSANDYMLDGVSH